MPIRPGTLQPIPPGLLSLLKLKSRGENPDTLGDMVVPTIDLTHWYGLDEEETVGGVVQVSSASAYINQLRFTATTLVVPQNEWWWVRAFGVSTSFNVLTCTAFDVAALAPMVFCPTVSGAVGVGRIIGEGIPERITNTIVAINNGSAISTPCMRDFWAQPGTGFGAYFAGSMTDPTNALYIEGYAQIHRMKI